MESHARLSEKVKVNFTEDECATLRRMAEARNLPLGPYIRTVVNDYLRTQLTRSETLLLEAVQELQANYLGVIQLQIDKRFSPATFAEMAEQNRLRRRALAHEFLLTAPASRQPLETDDDETEDPDDEEE